MTEKNELMTMVEIIGDKKKNIRGVIPMARGTWNAGVKRGDFPQPVRIGIKTIYWRRLDIDALIAGGSK